MAGWQHVDTKKLNRPRARTIRGVNVTVYFDQDDMPTGIKGEYSRSRRKFLITFRYDSDEESTKRIEYSEHATVFVGKRSERLFEVELDVDAMKVEEVQLLLPRVGEVLDGMAEHAPKGLDRQDNYVAASGAFKQVQPQLEAMIAP